MEIVKVKKGKHTWFIEHQDGTVTMETDWQALAREIEIACQTIPVKPATKPRRRGKTIKENKSG